MIDKAKIVYMTKLAVYDKNEAENDQNILRFFLNDYIYRQNLHTRIYVLLGYLLITGLNYLYKIMSGQIDIFMLDYIAELKGIAINAAIVLAFFTFISSAVAIYRFYEATKRQNKYIVMVNQLEKLNKIKQHDKEDTRDYNGSDIVYKRNNR